MNPVKRIEMIVPEHLLRELLDLVDRHRPGGYTVMRGLSGKGTRGVQSGDGIVGEFSNAWVLVACEAAVALPFIEELRPLLRRFGGMCLVSDAQSVDH
jgi:hypothetical protein